MYFNCHMTSQVHGSKGYHDIVGGRSQLYVTTLTSLVSISILIVEILVILICQVISRLTCLKGQWFYRWSHHLVIRGGHWSSASRDVTYLIYLLTSQDHVIEGERDFMSGSSSLYHSSSLNLAELVVNKLTKCISKRNQQHYFFHPIYHCLL